jgi:hypothetical protein
MTNPHVPLTTTFTADEVFQAALTLGRFYGYHWHVDERYYDAFVNVLRDVLEGRLVMPGGERLR